jgi:CheY-like chemotaxis protein
MSFARRRPPVRAALELGSFVRASEPLVRAALPGDVLLQIHIAGDVWVDGDEQQLRQALLNLVVNGGEAMGGSGILTITVDRTGSGDPLLTVSDTGTGMTPDVREHIFDPFFTTREDGRGTGLGLPIVRSIVADHGGTVLVDSKPGRGSTFAITLPGTSPPAETNPYTTAGTVLLVAPQGYAGELIAEGLRRHGDTVLSATTAEEAADHWSSIPVDVLVIDHRVGEVLGRSGRTQIPTVLTVDEETPVPAGVVALVEPYTLEDLQRAIDQALGFRPAGGRR